MNANYLRKNLDVLREYHLQLFMELKPEIDKFADNPDGDQNETFKIIDLENGLQDLFYERKVPNAKGLYHGGRPLEQTKEVYETLDLHYPTLVSFFGFGLGYVFNHFYKNRPQTNYGILIVEKNPQIFLRALCVGDFSEAFRDPTVGVIVESDTLKVRAKIGLFYESHTTVDRFLKVIPTPAALMSETEYYTDIGNALLELRDYVTVLAGNSILDCFFGLENTLINYDYITKNPGFAKLENLGLGETCISLAAGPSLNEHWETLRRVQGKIPIIACDTLVKPLQEHGVKVDIITALERDDYPPKFFLNFDIPERTSLVAPTLVKRECFDYFKGHHIIYGPSPSFIEALGLNFLGRFHAGSSAGNLNVGIAAYMGFKNIIMVGHNLAYGYKTNETHVKGTIDQTRETTRDDEAVKKDSAGLNYRTQDQTDIVFTRPEWNIFRQQIETTIASNPDKNWVNTAAKGSYIAGAELLTLEEALSKYVDHDFDIYPIKKAAFAPLSEIELQERSEQVCLSLDRCLSRIQYWTAETENLLAKMKKWRKKIEEKELVGKHVSNDFLDEALGEMLDLKVDATNKDRLFYNFAVALLFPYHIAFERIVNEMPGTYTNNYLLKRDFLFKHEGYFQEWVRWLPKACEKMEEAREKFFSSVPRAEVPLPHRKVQG